MEPPGGRAARLALGLALLCSALRAAAAAPAGPGPRSAVGESSWKAAAEPGGRGQRVWGSPVPADGYPARPQRGAAACRTGAGPHLLPRPKPSAVLCLPSWFYPNIASCASTSNQLQYRVSFK